MNGRCVMKKCENELDALNEINKKLHSVYLTLVGMFAFGLVAAYWAVNYIVQVWQPPT